MSSQKLDYGTYEATVARSAALEKELLVNPKKFLVLTGDRPTGALHIGHLFGSLQNRVRLQNLGVPINIVIADYQVLTDRDSFESISQNVHQLTIDYLAAGLDPEICTIYRQSDVPEVAELAMYFAMVTPMSWLERVPSYKEQREQVTEVSMIARRSTLSGSVLVLVRNQERQVGSRCAGNGDGIVDAA